MKLASFEGPYLQGSITYCKKALSECATLIWHFGVCFYLADAAVFSSTSRSVPFVTQFCSLSINDLPFIIQNYKKKVYDQNTRKTMCELVSTEK